MFIKKYFLLLLFLILNFLYQNNINFSLAKEIEIEYSKSKKEDFKIPYIKNEIENKNKIKNVFFNLSKKDFYKLNKISLDGNDVKEINNIIEKKFNKLENLLGKNKFTTQDKDFSFNAFQNINRNFRRLSKVNEQLDYITKTLQVMGHKVN